MLNKFPIYSSREYEGACIDARMLNFNISFNLFSHDEIECLTEKVINTFVKPFEHDYILETFCNDRDNISPAKFKHYFGKAVKKNHGGIMYSNFGFSGLKKCESIKSKRDLRESDLEFARKISIFDYYHHDYAFRGHIQIGKR